uniref:RING-type domain-containing protein n=1 Tax=Meloidogyne floridensis TaxID=298350 RepID=A0A915P952_9BILA
MTLTNLLFSFLILFLTTILPGYTNPIRPEQADCVADYLLISKNFKTEIFAEELDGIWKIQRGIPRKLLENLEIKREEMTELMSKDYAVHCFAKLGKQKDDNFLVEDIKTTPGKNHLILSQAFQDKLFEEGINIDIDESYFADCSICLEKVYENEQKLKKCKHVFDKKCIQEWLRLQQICPVCREATENELETSEDHNQDNREDQPQIENLAPNNQPQRNVHGGSRGK